MKHLKNFEKFNEGLFDFLSKKMTSVVFSVDNYIKELEQIVDFSRDDDSIQNSLISEFEKLPKEKIFKLALTILNNTDVDNDDDWAGRWAKIHLNIGGDRGKYMHISRALEQFLEDSDLEDEYKDYFNNHYNLK